MFEKSSDFEQLLKGAPPSPWQRFLGAPSVFIAQRLYALAKPVTPPPAGTLKVVCISDTHNGQMNLPNGDFLIHAGDLTKSGTFDELQQTINWIRSQPHQHKVVIAGNHDLLLDERLDESTFQNRDHRGKYDLQWAGIKYDFPPDQPSGLPAIHRRAGLSRSECGRDRPNQVTYLETEKFPFLCSGDRYVRIFGSPWTPKNGNWAFQYPRENNIWSSAVPRSTDILITHGPPKGHLDLGGRGCEHLLKELWRERPPLHVFGHIHEGYGTEWLAFDAIQEAFDKVMIAHGGFWNLVLLAIAVWMSWRPGAEERRGQTLLINAALAGGMRDELVRKPIVVTI